MNANLQDRVVMVTGASGGIGGEVVRAFHREGAKVIVHYREGRERAEALVKELGPNCLALGADLTKEDEVLHLFEESEKALGPVEVLIANAGVWPVEDVPLERMSLERWNHTLNANLTAGFLCLRSFLRGVAQHKLKTPSAVLIGSTAGIFGEAGHADYAAAKAGLLYGLAKSLKNEICRIAPRGRVNVVAPGWTLTPMTTRFSDNPERVKKALQTVPLRKVGRAHDVALAVVYLASESLSGHVTGQVLTVSGGMEGRVLYDPDEVEVE